MFSLGYFPTVLIWLALGLAVSLCISLVSMRFASIKSSYLRIGYRIFIPYLGLLTGALSPYLMGLSNIDWSASLGIGTGIFFAVLLVLALITATLINDMRRSQQERVDNIADQIDNGQPLAFLQKPDPHGLAAQSIAQSRLAKPFWFGYAGNWGLAGSAVEAVTEQFYWVFIRAAVWETLIQLQPTVELPAYHALWIAAFIAIPDLLLHTDNVYRRMSNICIFIATSILFFFTRNFWLSATLHMCMLLLLRHERLEQTVAKAESLSQSLRQIEAQTQ